MASYSNLPTRLPNFGIDPVAGLDLRTQPRWDLPERIIVKAAVVGGPIKRATNPHHPYLPEEIRREATGCIEAGAVSVHLHVRDENGAAPADPKRYIQLFRQIAEPIKETYGDKVIIDGCTLAPTFEAEMELIKSGLFEVSPVNAFAASPPNLLQAETEFMQENGVKPQIALYSDGDMDRAKRWLIDTGIMQKPYYWIILPSYLVGGTPMWNPMAMIESLFWQVRRIKEIDDKSIIMVCMAGRASSYLTTLAMIMGLHVRAGMEDTIYRWPHRDDLITSNGEVVASTLQIVGALGRKVATADEYRQMIGLKPKELVRVG